MSRDKIKILILGGGFGGVYTAKYLEKALRREELERIEITLVSRENYIVFQPLLPEVISGTLEILHCIAPIRRLLRRTQLYTREIEGISLEEKTVRLAPGFRPKPLTLHYDHLVVALGTLLDFTKVPGLREHAIPFKYLGDALNLRNHLVRILEEAEIEFDPEEKRKLLTIVVGGGGFSGVECIAEISDFLRTATKSYGSISANELRLVLLQSGERILPEMDNRLAEFAHDILTGRGVEICLHTRLKGVTANKALIEDKHTKVLEEIPTRTVVATVPAGPHRMITALPCEKERGRIKASKYLSVPRWPGLWAIGDCAAVPQLDGITSPPTAQHAQRQAKTCAFNILARIRNENPTPFTFSGLGKLCSLGHRSAVVDLLGVKLSGFLAWILWRIVYLFKFPGIEGKIRIFADWMMDLFLRRDTTQVRIFQQEDVAQEHFEAGEMIIEKGDYGDKVYFIVRGEVAIMLNGKEVALLEDGDVFGEMALVSDKPRVADCLARTPLDVVAVSRPAFHRLLAHMPGVRGVMESIMSERLGEEVDLGESA